MSLVAIGRVRPLDSARDESVQESSGWTWQGLSTDS